MMMVESAGAADSFSTRLGWRFVAAYGAESLSRISQMTLTGIATIEIDESGRSSLAFCTFFGNDNSLTDFKMIDVRGQCLYVRQSLVKYAVGIVALRT